MVRVERALRRRGHEVLNIGYPSRTADVETLAADVTTRIHAWEPAMRLDFVTHSLGGLVLRAMVARNHLPSERVHRAVMLGPPNSGSELADILPTMPVVGPLYRRYTGPAGLELGVGPAGVTARLPEVSFELGVIAGSLSLNPLFSLLLGEANDGKVRVSRTKVSGMQDFLIVRHWHPMLMLAPAVIAQVIHFLETGRFERDVTTSPQRGPS
jgi:triacylglycerol lipase